MEDLTVRKPPLSWWAAGLLLGLVQIMAVAMEGPLGVSTQFVIADAKILQQTSPEYVQNHPMISSEKYLTFGYGWWLDIGLVLGALLAAVLSGRWKLQTTTVWWRTNHPNATGKRLLFAFIGGFFILLGARFAHGCTSGQFASGWAQLSLAAVPFTITLFGFGMITARIVYPKVANFEKE